MADRIRTSTGAAHWSVGLGHQHDHTTQTQESTQSDWDIDTSLSGTPPGWMGSSTRAFLLRPSPPAKLYLLRPSSPTKLNDLQHKKQPGASSHAPMEPLAPLIGYCQPSHHGVTGIHRSKLPPTTPPWRCQCTCASSRSGKEP